MSFQDPDDRQAAAARAQLALQQKQLQEVMEAEALKRAGWAMKCHAECKPGLVGLQDRSKRHGNQSGDSWFKWELKIAGEQWIGWVFATHPEGAMTLVRHAAETDNVKRPFTITIKREWVVEDATHIATNEVKPT